VFHFARYDGFPPPPLGCPQKTKNSHQEKNLTPGRVS
jgi:hypothetical protein